MPDGQRETCDLSTLRGTYLYFDQGVEETGRTFAGAGYEYFDGAGHIYGVFSHHDHGASSTHYEHYIAEYDVTPDCTGYSNYDGQQFDLFIDPDGAFITFVLTEPSESEGVSGIERRVARHQTGDFDYTELEQ